MFDHRRQLIDLRSFEMTKCIVAVVFQHPRFFPQPFAQRPNSQPPESILIKVYLESVCFEQLAVVRRIVVALIIRIAIEPVDQQAPPTIAVAEVDRSVHSLNALLLEPLLALVEQSKRDRTVVHTIEKSYSTCRLFVAFIRRLPVHE